MRYFITIILCFLLQACGNSSKDAPYEEIMKSDDAVSTEVTSTFFPVGDFIKGQISEIKKKGINPMVITNKKSIGDTTWLKIEQFEEMINNLFSPTIDSSYISGFFREKKFFDETLNAYTFTYDPQKPLPDSVPWKNWIIYINPDNNAVERIFLVKKQAPDTICQLTWIPEKSCSIVTITNDSYIEEQKKIIWNFNN